MLLGLRRAVLRPADCRQRQGIEPCKHVCPRRCPTLGSHARSEKGVLTAGWSSKLAFLLFSAQASLTGSVCPWAAKAHTWARP